MWIRNRVYWWGCCCSRGWRWRKSWCATTCAWCIGWICIWKRSRGYVGYRFRWICCKQGRRVLSHIICCIFGRHCTLWRWCLSIFWRASGQRVCQRWCCLWFCKQVGIFMSRHTFRHEVCLFSWQGYEKGHTSCRDIDIVKWISWLEMKCDIYDMRHDFRHETTWPKLTNRN
jgi:hypothetical protein